VQTLEYGVWLSNAASVISAVNGLITVTGINNNSSATAGENGVHIVSGGDDHQLRLGVPSPLPALVEMATPPITAYIIPAPSQP